MNKALMPRIFRYDIRIKTSKGYYYRQYISCGKKHCGRCRKDKIGHPYWYYYPNPNPLNLVYYLKVRPNEIIKMWGRVISIFPKPLPPNLPIRIFNRK